MKRHYRFAILDAAVFVLAGAVVAAAQQPAVAGAPANRMASHAARIRFMGVAVRPTPPTEPVEISLSRWSTDADRAQVAAAFSHAKTPAAFNRQVRTLPVIGSIRTLSGTGDTIYFAQRVHQPNAMDRLILVTDPLYYWTPESTPNLVQPNYSVVQIELTPAGTGKGWVSYDGQHVTLDEKSQTLVMSDLSGQQPQLLDVKPLTTKDADPAFAEPGKTDGTSGAMTRAGSAPRGGQMGPTGRAPSR